jgi:hypothetical protein
MLRNLVAQSSYEFARNMILTHFDSTTRSRVFAESTFKEQPSC